VTGFLTGVVDVPVEVAGGVCDAGDVDTAGVLSPEAGGRVITAGFLVAETKNPTPRISITPIRIVADFIFTRILLISNYIYNIKYDSIVYHT
jgi:hypothetical protein